MVSKDIEKGGCITETRLQYRDEAARNLNWTCPSNVSRTYHSLQSASLANVSFWLWLGHTLKVEADTSGQTCG